MIERIEWGRECETGDPVLDTGRRQLTTLINRLLDCVTLPRHAEVFFEINDRVTDYAFKILEGEAKRLDRLGAPLSAAHAAAHLQFQEFVADYCLQATFNTNEPLELLDFLIAWWHGHAMGYDLADSKSMGQPAAPACWPLAPEFPISD